MAGTAFEMFLLFRTFRSTNLSMYTSSKLASRFFSVVAKKLVFKEFGKPEDVVFLEEEILQEPKDDQVLVQMIAAPVNPADIGIIQGAYGLLPKLPAVPGIEGVGEVKALGTKVSKLERFDWVVPIADVWGSWRTHAVCHADELMKVPDDISVVQAATLLSNLCTAYVMLKGFVQVQPGETVIQNGANSAVGQNVIQMCKAWGVKSVNIVRKRMNDEELKEYLNSLGATCVLLDEDVRTTEIFKNDSLQRPRLALNCVGGKNAQNMMYHLVDSGVMVTYGGMAREPVAVPTSALIFKDIHVVGFWITDWMKKHLNGPEWKDMLNDIYGMIRKGALRPPQHEIVPLSQYMIALKNTMNKDISAGRKFLLNLESPKE